MFRYFRITSYLNEIVDHLSPRTWFHWYISFGVDTPISFTPLLHKQTWRQDIESPAVEVYHIREKYGYFASKNSIDFFKY